MKMGSTLATETHSRSEDVSPEKAGGISQPPQENALQDLDPLAFENIGVGRMTALQKGTD